MILALPQTRLQHRLSIAIALPIVLLLLLSGVSIWQITRLLSALRWVEHTDQVISSANYAQKLLLDQETGFRGYLLTGRQNFLQPYEQANAQIDSSLLQLRNLVADNAQQVQQVDDLILQSQQWEQQVLPAIARRQRGEPEPLSELERRKQMMDRMRLQIQSLIQTEERLRNRRSQTVQQTTRSVIATSGLLAIGVGTGLAYFLYRQTLRISQIYQTALDTAQVKTEEAERSAAALQQYKDIFQFAQYGLVVGAADNQTLTLMNPAFAQMHGYTVEELTGSPILTVFPSDYHAAAIDFIRQVNQRGVYSLETYHQRKDGTIFPVFLTGTAVRDAEGMLLYRIVSVYDFTEVQQAQVALQRSAQRLETLHEIDRAILAAETDEALIGSALVQLRQIVPHQQAFVTVFDLAAATAQIIAGSSQTGQLSHPIGTQLTIADFALSQSSLSEIRLVENLATVAAPPVILQQLRSHGFRSCLCLPLRLENTLVGELNLASTELTVFDHEAQEIVQEVAAQLAIALQQSRLQRQLQATNQQLQRELLERQFAEAELREQEQLFRFTFNQAAVGIAHVSPDGRWLRVNQRLCEIIGYSREELLQSTFQDITYPEDLDIDLTYVRQMLAGEIQTYAMEKRYVRKNSALIWINLTVALVRETNGEPKYFISVVEDISDRKHTEAALQQLNATLEQRVSERTAQLEEINQELEAFTYSVSHDLRAPLRTMRGFATALLDDCGDQLEDYCRTYIDSIIEDAVQMNDLISDLLTYSRLTRTQITLQPIALANVIDEALDQLTAQIQETQAQIQVTTPLPTVMAYRPILVQAIANLISNGIKFTQPDISPLIDIFTTIERHDNHEWIQLWIVDNGIGIAPEHHERIFRVFERLHGAESYPGTGIGLAIVRKGLERMGGRVGVESHVGQGSRFWLALPKAVFPLNNGTHDPTSANFTD